MPFPEALLCFRQGNTEINGFCFDVAVQKPSCNDGGGGSSCYYGRVRVEEVERREEISHLQDAALPHCV